MFGSFCVLSCICGFALVSAQELPPQSKALPANNNEETSQAKPELPPGFQPPRTIPAVMTYTKELITEAENESLQKDLLRDRYRIVFYNAQLNDANKAIINKWAKQRFYEMTLKNKRRHLHELRDQLMRDIGNAGKANDAKKKDVVTFRTYMCQEVTKRASELLKNNFYVRLNAAVVLANLNLTEENKRKEMPEQAYAKAAIPLMEVLKTKTGGGIDEQLEAVKIQAAIGVGRIGLLSPLGDLDVAQKNAMADTLIAQLQDPGTHEWYQKRLLDALGELDFQNDVNTGKPIILEALSEVLVDKERNLCVRARAARSLGRCHLPPGINAEKLVFQILLLENEMAFAYQKDPNAFYWLDCFADLYFAFHPVSEREIEIFGNKRPPGLNAKNLGNTVRDAYSQLLPIATHVVTQDGWIPPREGGERTPNTKIPDQLISNLAKWLQDHQPSSHKLAPNLPELAPTSPMPNTKVGTNTTSG